MDLPDRMIHQSTRYVLGRMSYAVSEHCEWLICNWDSIPDSARATIQRDVEAEFERSERTGDYSNFGHTCDIEDWQDVRALWRQVKPVDRKRAVIIEESYGDCAVEGDEASPF